MKDYYFVFVKRYDLSFSKVMYELVLGAYHRFFLFHKDLELNYKENICEGLGIVHLKFDDVAVFYDCELNLSVAAFLTNNFS